MRGEHRPRPRLTHARPGSSPHARGTPHGAQRLFLPVGIIPACAGNTWLSPRPGSRPGDHPRMRGEHASVSGAFTDNWGSSPHARGTPMNRGMGKPKSRDHPRMRGEHGTPDMWAEPLAGSSPHARGTQTLYLVKSVFRFWSGSFFGFVQRACRPVVGYLFCGLLNMRASLMRRLGPVNSMSRPWWTMRSMIAAASLSSAKIVPHLPNSMFVVKMTLLRS